MSTPLYERIDLTVPLLGRAIVGDPAAVNQVLTLARPALVVYCRRRMPTRLDMVEDVVQEALIHILAALPEQAVPACVERFRGLMFTIAQRRVFDLVYRADRRRPRPWSLDVDPDMFHAYLSTGMSPERIVVGRVELERLAALLSGLPEKQRPLPGLRAAGLTAAEMADRVGMTEIAVRVGLHRALLRLRPRVEL